VFDDRGEFHPTLGDHRRVVDTDQVILAVGQTPDLSFLEGRSDIPAKGGLITVDERTLQTGRKGVYAGGDVTALSGSVVHAIAAGRRAAIAIDKALGGSGEIDAPPCDRGSVGRTLPREEGFSSRPRERVQELEPQLRRAGFQEVALGFSRSQAEREARRCLQCDLRLLMGRNPSPPERCLAFDEANVNQAPEAGGVFRLYDGDHRLIALKGTANLKRDLLRALRGNGDVVWFDLEEEPMYTRRESELIQEYVRAHGRMPGDDADLDDLF